jgi:hypothetical protein
MLSGLRFYLIKGHARNNVSLLLPRFGVLGQIFSNEMV